MKKKLWNVLLIILCMTIFLSACGNKKEPDRKNSEKNTASQSEKIDKAETIEKEKIEATVPQEHARFKKTDVMVEQLSFGMTMEEVERIFGQPNTIENSSNDNFLYGEYVEYQYSDKTLMFYDVYQEHNLVLGDVILTGSGASLTNGLSVGCSVDDVLAYYAKDYEPEERPLGSDRIWGYMLYGDYLYTSETGYALPEKEEYSGFYTLPFEGSDEYYVTYACYEPAGEGYKETQIVFYVDGRGMVCRIVWDYNYYA